jgi:hypothetical protein
VAALTVLLLLMLVIVASSHVVAAPLFVILLTPVFLFADVEVTQAIPCDLEGQSHLLSEPGLSALFQRPPPSLLG